VKDAITLEHKFPPGWADLDREASRLFAEGKQAESTAMLETFVASHPDFADAHFMLAANHEGLARDSRDDPAKASERKRHLETAVAHYGRFRELKSDPDDRAQASSVLVGLYGPEGLNRPDEAVAIAREYTLERPLQPGGYASLARMLRWQGSHEAATTVLLETLQRFPRGQRNSQLNDELVAHVEETPQLSREIADQLLAEALWDAERLIADSSTRGLGLLSKSHALRAAARRTDQSPERQKELEAESDRLQKEALAVQMGK
jgi:hypothetical protein